MTTMARLRTWLALLVTAAAAPAQLTVVITSPDPSHVSSLSSEEVRGVVTGVPGPPPVDHVYVRTRYPSGARNANVIEDGSWSDTRLGWAYPVIWDAGLGSGTFTGRVKWMREGSNWIEVYLPGDTLGAPSASQQIGFQFEPNTPTDVVVVTHPVQRNVDVTDPLGNPGELAFRLDVVNTTPSTTFDVELRAEVTLPGGGTVPLELGGPGLHSKLVTVAPGDGSHVAANDPSLSFRFPLTDLVRPVPTGVWLMNVSAHDASASAITHSRAGVAWGTLDAAPPPIFEERDFAFLVEDRTGKPFRDITHLSALGDVQIQGSRQVGAGLAAFDYDGDGLTDLFLANPGGDTVRLDSLNYLVPHPGGRNWLMRNEGDGSWTDVTAQAGVEGLPLVASNGAAWADVDNDGDNDLAVANFLHPIYLYRNDGDGTFTDVADSALGSPGPNKGVMPRFGDVDADGDHDLYLGTSLDAWKFDYIHLAAPNELWRNDLVEGGTDPTDPTFPSFTDISTGSGADLAVSTLGALFFDADRDGHLDLAVHPDFGAFIKPNTLLRGHGDGTFTDVSAAAGYEKREFSMGAAAEDFDGDGDLDVYSTSIGLNALASNDGDGTFTQSIHGSGAEADVMTLGPEADGLNLNENWGPVGFDYDADMDMDLWVAGSYLWTTYQLPVAFFHPDSFFENDGTGHFTEVSGLLGTDSGGRARGAVLVDVDGDVDLDLVVSNWGEGLTVLRNDVVTRHNAVLLRPMTRRSAPGGFNTRLEVSVPGRTQVREVMACSPHAGSLDNVMHFGLGTSTECAVTAAWQRGGTTIYPAIAAGGEVLLHETVVSIDDAIHVSAPVGAQPDVVLLGEPLTVALGVIRLRPGVGPAGARVDFGISPGLDLVHLALLDDDGRAPWPLPALPGHLAGRTLTLEMMTLDGTGGVRCRSGVSTLSVTR